MIRKAGVDRRVRIAGISSFALNLADDMSMVSGTAFSPAEAHTDEDGRSQPSTTSRRMRADGFIP